ncbi:MAG: ribonuclease P protein component [Gammaproteobacteria bacterium]
MNKFFLTRREEFRAVARRGRRKTGVFWSLRYKPVKLANMQPEDAKPAARFAVSVSKRHLRRASRRNRLRRVLRESFRQVWANELFACDYIVASASAFAKSGEDELRDECRRLLNEASAVIALKSRNRQKHKS